jgi:hypothetical protein
MSYVRSDDGLNVTTWPYNRRNFREDYPHVSFPSTPRDDQLQPFGIYPIVDMPQPGYDPATQRPREVAPIFQNGQWEQQWVVEALPQDQIDEIAQEAQNDQDKSDILADTFVGTFIGFTPAQVENYVETNVTDLAGAKNVLKKLGKLVLLLARREFS